MELWNKKTRQFEEMPNDVYAFLDEIEYICRKYDMSISHEDSQGSFILERFKDENIDWLNNLSLNR